MKGRFKGYDVSHTIGISQDGMFLGRPEFHRMVCFRGWGVSTELYISALYKPHVCTRPLLHFGLNSGIPVIAARAISDLVRFTNTAMFVGMSTMRQIMYIPKKSPS